VDVIYIVMLNKKGGVRDIGFFILNVRYGSYLSGAAILVKVIFVKASVSAKT